MTWNFAVCSLMARRSAMARLDRPWPMSCRTSSSRGVSDSTQGLGGRAGVRRAPAERRSSTTTRPRAAACSAAIRRAAVRLAREHPAGPGAEEIGHAALAAGQARRARARASPRRRAGPRASAGVSTPVSQRTTSASVARMSAPASSGAACPATVNALGGGEERDEAAARQRILADDEHAERRGHAASIRQRAGITSFGRRPRASAGGHGRGEPRAARSPPAAARGLCPAALARLAFRASMRSMTWPRRPLRRLLGGDVLALELLPIRPRTRLRTSSSYFSGWNSLGRDLLDELRASFTSAVAVAAASPAGPRPRRAPRPSGRAAA